MLQLANFLTGAQIVRFYFPHPNCAYLLQVNCSQPLGEIHRQQGSCAQRQLQGAYKKLCGCARVLRVCMQIIIKIGAARAQDCMYCLCTPVPSAPTHVAGAAASGASVSASAACGLAGRWHGTLKLEGQGRRRQCPHHGTRTQAVEPGRLIIAPMSCFRPT